MTGSGVSRRVALSAAVVGAATSAIPALRAQPILMTPADELMPKGTKRRVVIVGAGWGGLTAARHLRERVPELEVVLLERNPLFWSCPMSNKWLIDIVDTQFLQHSYTAAARRLDYTFVQTEVTGIDRSKRRVHSAHGTVDYDWLIVSAGIRVAYEPWFGNDRRAISHTASNYGSAYVPSAEHLALKQRIQAFKGGTLVMTLPPPPHRCPPSPYERACLIADWFQRHEVPAKIVILDPKPRIAPIGSGYKLAFEDLYDETITHVPNATVQQVDPFGRVVRTSAGEFRFDEAILMGHHQAADIVWKMDAIGRTPEGKPTGWADVDPQLYNLRNDPQVYVIGDSVGAVSPHFGHYPKSGHVANGMARSVAGYIAAQAKGQTPKPELIDNLCYMLVNTEPMEALNVQFDYKVGADGKLEQIQVDDNDRRNALWQEDLRWYGSKVKDLTGA